MDKARETGWIRREKQDRYGGRNRIDKEDKTGRIRREEQEERETFKPQWDKKGVVGWIRRKKQDG